MNTSPPSLPPSKKQPVPTPQNEAQQQCGSTLVSTPANAAASSRRRTRAEMGEVNKSVRFAKEEWGHIFDWLSGRDFSKTSRSLVMGQPLPEVPPVQISQRKMSATEERKIQLLEHIDAVLFEVAAAVQNGETDFHLLPVLRVMHREIGVVDISQNGTQHLPTSASVKKSLRFTSKEWDYILEWLKGREFSAAFRNLLLSAPQSKAPPVKIVQRKISAFEARKTQLLAHIDGELSELAAAAQPDEAGLQLITVLLSLQREIGRAVS